MSINDQAILYRSKFLSIKSTINNLKLIGINVDNYLKKLEKINDDVKEQVANYNKEITTQKINLKDLNTIYNKGIVKLEDLSSEFSKYDDYIKGYGYCEYLKSKLSGEEVSEQTLNEYAEKLCNYIALINNTDTRDYSEEANIVESIYEMAYLIMKLEFVSLGKSRIFENAKDNPVIAAFINNLVEKDIENLRASGKDTKLINQSINKIMSNGINATYFDETLITLIALKDDNSLINKIKDKLNSLADEIKENSSKITKIKRNMSTTSCDLSSERKRLHNCRKDNAIELLKRATAAVVVLSSLFGGYLLARKGAKVREYKTKKETFSSVSGYSLDETYETQSDMNGKTLLYVYDQYEKKSGYYRRKYVVYDVSNISSECETLDDYLKLNLEHAADRDKGSEEKSNSEMTEEDFNLESEIKVLKVDQDLENYNEYTSTGATVGITLLLALVIGAVEGFILFMMYDDDCFDSLDDLGCEKDRIKGYLAKFREEFASLKELMDSNKKLKEEFSSVYESYKALLDLSEIDKFSESVLIPDPQIELDRREEKLLKRELKK